MWTRIYEICGLCKRPLVVFNAVCGSSVSLLIATVFAVKYGKIIEKLQKCVVLGLHFLGEGIAQILDMHFHIVHTLRHVADFS